MIALLLGGNQSVLNPQGPHALSISQLNNYMTLVLSIAYVITMAMLAWALFSGRRDGFRARGSRVMSSWPGDSPSRCSC